MTNEQLANRLMGQVQFNDALDETCRALMEAAADKLRGEPAAPAPVAGDDARDLIESFVQHADANAHDGYPRKLVESARSWLAGFSAPVPGDAVAKLPPLPQAFFDEFGICADDRVQDYAYAALAQDRASQGSDLEQSRGGDY